jgi:hypothetical protein
MGTPQLNIKDAETTRLVRELAELTGETQTEVVRKALRERLQREKPSVKPSMPAPPRRSAASSKGSGLKSKKFRKMCADGDLQRMRSPMTTCMTRTGFRSERRYSRPRFFSFSRDIQI